MSVRLHGLLAALGLVLAATVGAAPTLVAGDAAVLMPMPADARAQLNPVVAHDGKGTYLVVWQQGRFYHQTQGADILAARVDAAGRVLDRQPIVVCAAEASQERPRVAYADGRFLVVWHDFRNGRDWDVYAAHVMSDGTVLEPGGFLLAGGVHNQASPVVAPADAGALVVWQHYDRHYALRAAIVSAKVSAGAQPLEFRGERLVGGRLALARAGTGWLLSWNDETAWTKSGGLATMVTRHFAPLALRNGRLDVLEVRRSPAVDLGRADGIFVGDGASRALYAGWGAAGKGGNRIATAALFDAGRAMPLANPNPERARPWSGWNTEHMIALYNADVPVDGPVAAAFGEGMYLVVAREAYTGKASDRNRLLGARLSAAGMRLDRAPAWQILHESEHRLGHPALATGRRQFLLAFEQEDAAGRRRIWARILRAG